MKYELPNEITNSVCYYLNSSNQLVVYPTRRSRTIWVRSGSKWYKASTTTSSSYDYDLSGITCLREPPEYEYSFVEPIYQYISAIVVCFAFVLAFWLIIYRLFKGGSRW